MEELLRVPVIPLLQRKLAIARHPRRKNARQTAGHVSWGASVRKYRQLAAAPNVTRVANTTVTETTRRQSQKKHAPTATPT